MSTPKKPTDFAIWLVHCQPIRGLILDYVQTGTDTSDTFVRIISNEPEKRVRFDTLRPLIDFSPDWIRLVQVKDQVRREVEEWEKFAKAEARDLAELKRLKEKFGESK